MRVCAGAAAELRGAAGEVLQGVQGALREYGAVYGEGGGWAYLSSGLGSLCAGLFRFWPGMSRKA